MAVQSGLCLTWLATLKAGFRATWLIPFNYFSENESMTLIQKLAKLTMEQSGEDLSDIDPRTGARRKTVTQQDNRTLEEGVGVDEESEVIKGPTRGVDDKSRSEKAEAAAVAGFLDEQRAEDMEKVKKQTSSCGTNTGDFVPRVITPRVPPMQPPPKSSSPGMEHLTRVVVSFEVC